MGGNKRKRRASNGIALTKTTDFLQEAWLSLLEIVYFVLFSFIFDANTLDSNHLIKQLYHMNIK